MDKNFRDALFSGVPLLAILVALLWPIMRRRSRSGGVVRGLVILGIPAAAIAVALILPAIQRTVPVPPRVECRNNLKQLALALYQYHENQKCYLPAYVVGPDGRRWHSWRVFLLPYLDSQRLHRQYRFDEPWDSEHNRKLWNQCPSCYRCPTDPQQTAATNYVAVVGQSTMWPGAEIAKFSDCKDGSANTIHLMEISPGVPWLAPVDVSEEEAIADLGKRSRFHIPKHETIRHAAMVDGSVRVITAEDATPETVWAMLTRKGGEPTVTKKPAK
jgi:hypothetical protein